MAKIVIADDSPTLRRIVTSVLTKAGHEVVAAEDGIGAVQAVFLHQPDAVVLDGQITALPELSAAIAGKLVGRTRPEEKVVVLLTADDMTFQRNVELMHAIRKAGGEVAIMYEEEAK